MYLYVVLGGGVVQLGDQQRHPARGAQAAALQVVAAGLHAPAGGPGHLLLQEFYDYRRVQWWIEDFGLREGGA